jgi:hypothetical protein
MIKERLWFLFMELHSTVFHGNHIFLHQSQIFHIKKFWHALSVHNNTYDSPRHGPPVGNSDEICVKLKKLDRYIYEKFFFRKFPCFLYHVPKKKILPSLSVHNCILNKNCNMWQPPAGPDTRQYFLKCYSRTTLYCKNQFKPFF